MSITLAVIIGIALPAMVQPVSAAKPNSRKGTLKRAEKKAKKDLQKTGNTRYSILKIGLAHPTEAAAVQGWPGKGTKRVPYRIVLPHVSPKLKRKNNTFRAEIQVKLQSNVSDFYGIWTTVLERPKGAPSTVFRKQGVLNRTSVNSHPNGNVRTPLGFVEMDGLVEGLYKLELKSRYKDKSFGPPKEIWIRVTNPTIQVTQLYHGTDKYDGSKGKKLAGTGTVRNPFLLTSAQASQDGWLRHRRG